MRFVTLMAALLVSASGFASSTNKVILPHVQLNEQATTYTGVVNMDLEQNMIHVAIYQDHCGTFAAAQPGVLRCMMMPTLIESYVVPVQEKSSSCGSVYYKGTVENEDGTQTEVKVVDHSQRVCMDLLLSNVQASIVTTDLRTNDVKDYELSR